MRWIIGLVVFVPLICGGQLRGPAVYIDTGDDPVAYYLVVEKVNMSFGSRVTTYRVTHPDLISKHPMGPNCSRTVTPKYAKLPPRRMAYTIASPVAVKPAFFAATFNPVAARVPARPFLQRNETATMTVDIDLIATYERVLDKGYTSVDLLKKVANQRFFSGDLILAAKWYSRLFEVSPNLEAIYYYRFAQALKAVNRNDESAKMLAVFREKDR